MSEYKSMSGYYYPDFDNSPEALNHLNGLPGRPHKGKSVLYPTRILEFPKYQSAAKAIYREWSQRGMNSYPKNTPPELELWCKYLVYNLHFWEAIPIKKCITPMEIAYGNLIEGPDFTEWLKKARAFTLQSNIGLGDMNIKEEYILPDWEGYDSIFPESSLIHWAEEVNDFPYCMIPLEHKLPEDKIYEFVLREIRENGPEDLHLKGANDILRIIKASKTQPLDRKKSALLRDIFPDLKKPGAGWWGKRTIVQAFPGGSRDASTADPSTLIKIKLSSEIFLAICQHHIHSAMADHRTANHRIGRLREKPLFLHFDFKKVGLLLPRRLLVLVMKAIGEVYDIDVSWFDFDDLFIEVDGETIATKRGYALGWMNEGVTLVIIFLMMRFRRLYKLNFDFLVFNDDVEIGFRTIESEAKMRLIRSLLIEYFQKHDIYCSVKKIYFSKESIFLEEYHAPDSKFDFEKRSIAARIYAKAAITSYPFLRKSYVNVANMIWPNKEIQRKIIAETAREWDIKHMDEFHLPFEAGGFLSGFESGFNTFLRDYPNHILVAEQLDSAVAIETTKPDFGFDAEKSESRKYSKMSKARGNLPPSLSLPHDEIIETRVDLEETLEEALLVSLELDDPLLELIPVIRVNGYWDELPPAGVG